MFDAGLYSFAMMWQIQQQDCAFLIKVSSHPHLPVLKRLSDGSYLSEMKGKLLDAQRSTDTRNAWLLNVYWLRLWYAKASGIYRLFRLNDELFHLLMV